MKNIKDEHIGLRITSDQSNDLKALCSFFRVNRSEVLRLALNKLFSDTISQSKVLL